MNGLDQAHRKHPSKEHNDRTHGKWNVCSMLRRSKPEVSDQGDEPPQQQQQQGHGRSQRRNSTPAGIWPAERADEPPAGMPSCVWYKKKRSDSLPTVLDVSFSSEFDEEIDAISVVSEVTMMTYTDEKTSMIKEMFFQRIREQSKSRVLTFEEKEKILRDIKIEQDETFRRLREENNSLGHDLLERLNALKLQKLNQKSQAQVQIESTRDPFEHIISRIQDKRRRDSHTNSITSSASPKQGKMMRKSSSMTIKQGNVERESSHRRNESFSFSPTIQEKEPVTLGNFFKHFPLPVSKVPMGGGRDLSSVKTGDMGPQEQDCQEEQGKDEEQMVFVPEFFSTGTITADSNLNLSSFYSPESNAMKRIEQANTCPQEPADQEEEQKSLELDPFQDERPSTPSTLDTTSHEQDVSSSNSINSKALIDDIIQLKLLVANQQATIDTLSSKQHNLELANRQQLDATKREELRRRDEEYKNQKLMDENIELRRRLDEMNKSFGTTSRRVSMF